jgi:hypothetical protein
MDWNHWHWAQIWDIRSKMLIQHYAPNAGVINSVCFHPSGNFLLSTCEDSTIRVWPLKTWVPSASVQYFPFLHHGFISPSDCSSFCSLFKRLGFVRGHVQAPKWVHCGIHSRLRNLLHLCCKSFEQNNYIYYKNVDLIWASVIFTLIVDWVWIWVDLGLARRPDIVLSAGTWRCHHMCRVLTKWWLLCFWQCRWACMYATYAATIALCLYISMQHDQALLCIQLCDSNLHLCNYARRQAGR